VVQVGTFVEVTFERTGQKRLFRLDSGAVSLLDEIVLLVHDRVVGQNSQRFAPYAVQALVLGGGLREDLREFHPESDGKVAVLADDTALLDSQKRKTALQRYGFKRSLHGRRSD